VSVRWVNGSWWPVAIATNFARQGSWHISSTWLRLDGFPRDCELLTTATVRGGSTDRWKTIVTKTSNGIRERNIPPRSNKHRDMVVKTRRRQRAGVSLRGDLCYDSWSLSHLGYLFPRTTPVIIKLDHNKSCPWVWIAQVTKASTITLWCFPAKTSGSELRITQLYVRKHTMCCSLQTSTANSYSRGTSPQTVQSSSAKGTRPNFPTNNRVHPHSWQQITHQRTIGQFHPDSQITSLILNSQFFHLWQNSIMMHQFVVAFDCPCSCGSQV